MAAPARRGFNSISKRLSLAAMAPYIKAVDVSFSPWQGAQVTTARELLARASAASVAAANPELKVSAQVQHNDKTPVVRFTFANNKMWSMYPVEENLRLKDILVRLERTTKTIHAVQHIQRAIKDNPKLYS